MAESKDEDMKLGLYSLYNVALHFASLFGWTTRRASTPHHQKFLGRGIQRKELWMKLAQGQEI